MLVGCKTVRGYNSHEISDGHVCDLMRYHHLITTAVLIAVAHATGRASQQPFDVPVLAPNITDIIQKIVDTHQIPGLALAVVRKNGHSEFGTWGNRSEDGATVTEDVC